MCRYLWLRRRRSPEASPRLEASQTQEEKKKRKREEEEEKKRKKRKEKDKKKKRRALDERHERERERERQERESKRAPRRNCETKRNAERRTLNRTPDKYYEVFWFEEQSELKREHLFERREQTFDKRKTKHSRLWV